MQEIFGRIRSASNFPVLDDCWPATLTLCLPIKMAGVKPAGAMKTLSGTFAIVVLAVLVTVAVVSCTFQLVPNQKFLLYIGTKPILVGKPTYVYWTTEEEFDDALKQVCQHGGTYKIRKLKAEGEEPYDAKSCKEILKTDKVTKSKAADGAAVGESAGNDPNVTHKIAATKKEDITKILSALEPSPTP
jgi:hypothetical protein